MRRMASSLRETPDAYAGLERRELFLRLQSVTVYVSDLDRSLDFYRDQLGFHLVFDARTQPGARFVAVAPPDGSANLTLVEPEPDSSQAKRIGSPTHVTFVTEDVLAKFREWRQRGVRFTFTPRLKRLKYKVEVHSTDSEDGALLDSRHTPIWGGVFARFKDPDGNSFSLVSFDEVTNAVEGQRRAAAQKLESERSAAQELEIARRVQARLFPQTHPRLRTLEYAGVCHQARQVGGDYYDFLDLGSTRLGLVIGDISGKGIAAALLMANLQANLRSQSAIALDHPQRLLCSVNQLFCENTTDGAFATLFFADYDDAGRRLRYVNCGHLPALLLRDDGSLEHLDSTATIIGAFKIWDCDVGEVQLSAGDTIALYTDGITESFNDADEQFGEDRLIECLRRHRALAPCDLLGAVVEEVRQFSPREQRDDITLIIGKALPWAVTPVDVVG
jgi:serine phosphatase RsbU (regulator of sigma subunit)/catechol 2,3-dioxygenase-like lactoylglutathione lyase family enzyme